MNIGGDIQWQKLDGRNEEVNEIIITGFPVGSYVIHDIPEASGQSIHDDIPSRDYPIIIQGTESEVRAALSSLEVRSPLHSDQDFELSVTIMTDDPIERDTATCDHLVTVLAIADKPNAVSATSIAMDQKTDPAAASAPTEEKTETPMAPSVAVLEPARRSLLSRP